MIAPINFWMKILELNGHINIDVNDIPSMFNDNCLTIVHSENNLGYDVVQVNKLTFSEIKVNK